MLSRDHRVCCGTEFDLSQRWLALPRMAAPVGLFRPSYFDGNEGGANDVFFFDQNTGVVSGSVFDGRGAIARTTDAGMNWSTLFFDQAIEGVAFPTAASGFAVGAVGRILHTTDTGTTWTDQTSGSSANLHDISFASDALTGITVGDGGTILRTTNGGEPSPTPSPTPTSTTPTERSKAYADTKISSNPETSPDSSAVGAANTSSTAI